MLCVDVQELLTPFVDGELDLMRSLEVEGHLRDCPGCDRLAVQLRDLREAFSTPTLRNPLPPGLRERLQSSLRAVDPPPRRSVPWRWLAVAAAVFLTAGVAWIAFRPPLSSQPNESVMAEVVSGHVRSLLAEHLLDVKSSDRHTVRPWFQGRLSFSPPVPDLAEHGFVLAGGRLDYLQGRPVAAVVYRRRAHVINLFGWPAHQPTERIEERQGYHLIAWSAGGMTWWAISDLNEKELREFVRLFREAATPAEPVE
jgi:anti-sigma factor RsiW